MEDYELLIKLGFFASLAILTFLLFRALGFRLPTKAKKSKRKGRKRSGKKSEKETFFQQEAYVDDGDGNTEWEDSDMYAMKEGKTGKPVAIDMELEKKKKDQKYESWDDY